MRFFSDLFKSWRAKGDRARDRGDWRAAERAYRRHLKRCPSDMAIWIQHGHSLMQTGRPGDAAAAYRVAFEDDPTNLELLGQLSFSLRDAGQRRDARSALLDLYARQPSEETRGEIILLDDPVRGERGGFEAGATFLSLQDFLGYLKVHPTMSGVQRVQAGIARHAAGRGGPTHFIVNSLTASCDILPRGTFWMIPNGAVSEIIRYASSATVEPTALRRLILAAEDLAVRVRPGAGTTIVLLGAFWALGNSARAILPNREAGATVVAYIYDIIPLTYPQYCEPELCRDFGMSFCEACALVDAFLTISDATCIAVSDFLNANGLRAVPMRTVRLAHRLTDEHEGNWMAAIEPPGGRNVVAYVSTIEARKNHLYVVRAWQEMLRMGVDVPDLLFVGRLGWRIEALSALLDETRFLDGRVRFVHDLDDGELDLVYRSSLFTVFTSFVEGWGLPVGESLARGTPCIASSVSSIPEVGGAFADYVDLDDLSSGVRVFTRAIVDSEWRIARQAEIRRDFEARNWDDVGLDFFAALGLLTAGVPVRTHRSPVWLDPGVLFVVGRLATAAIDIRAYAHHPWRVMLTDFYDPEPGGAWLRGDCGELLIPSTVGGGQDIDVLLSLRGDPAQSSRILTVGVDGGTDIHRRLGELEHAPIVVRARTRADGVARIAFDVGGGATVGSQGARQFAIALVAFGHARSSDASAMRELITEEGTWSAERPDSKAAGPSDAG